MRKHWYRTFIGECCHCGKDKSYRVRVYGERPAKREDRYSPLSLAETFCCHGDFM